MTDTELILYGPGYSTYTRTVRLALEEKTLPYKLVEVDFLRGANKTQDHLSRHPFGKVPILEHGALILYETAAITDYVDSAFPGTTLRPQDARARARMLQMIGIIVAYIYAPMVGQIVVERMIKPLLGQPTDQTAIDAGMRRLRKGLGVVEHLVEGPSFLIEDSISLADLYLVPMWAYFLQTPEGETVAPTFPRLAKWWSSVRVRPSVQTTDAVRLLTLALGRPKIYHVVSARSNFRWNGRAMSVASSPTVVLARRSPTRWAQSSFR